MAFSYRNLCELCGKIPMHRSKDFELVEAVRSMDFDKVRELVFEGADVNARDIETEFLKGKREDFITMSLMIAVEKDNLDIATSLVNKGTDINVTPIWTVRRKTLLCAAIGNKNREMVELLLVRGADPNKKCRIDKMEKGITNSLRLTRLLDYNELAELLIANGASDIQKNTPAGTSGVAHFSNY